jgi:K+-sensing histidine kinase KdpD
MPSSGAALTPMRQCFHKRSKNRMQRSKIQARQESERLKLVFLDAITHDFRTPLTSIKASVTGLLDDLETDREQRKELLTIIDEECDRIDQLVSEASEIARMESGEMKLDLQSHSVEELISAALADCRIAASNRKICLDVEHPDLRLLVDFPLAKRALVLLITNAQLYSCPGEPIRIAANKLSLPTGESKQTRRCTQSESCERAAGSRAVSQVGRRVHRQHTAFRAQETEARV